MELFADFWAIIIFFRKLHENMPSSRYPENTLAALKVLGPPKKGKKRGVWHVACLVPLLLPVFEQSN